MKAKWLVAAAMMLAVVAANAQSPERAHNGGFLAPVPARELAAWEPGTFLESIAIAPDGTAYVARHEAGAVDQVRDGQIKLFAKLPGTIAGILLSPDGGLLATGRTKGGPETVYAVDANGNVTVLATVPGGGFLNGLTWLNDRLALIADSDAGVIWQLDTTSRAVSAWARDPLLDHADKATHFPVNTGFPAANGVKRHGDAVYVSNSGRGAILRIPVSADGQAGKVEIWARDMVADDFAFDKNGNAYIPTHPMQSVVRLSPDGTRTTIATPAQGLAGPTAVTFGPDGALYVVGNAAIPISGAQRRSALIRLDVASPASAPATQTR